MGTSREDSVEQRRRDILSASLRLFVVKGYDGTTVRDISRATKTSNGLLFHYFPSKEDILVALAKLAMERVAMVAQMLSAGGDPVKIFERITAALLQAFASEEGRNLFLLVSQIQVFGAIPEVARRIVRSIDVIALSLPLIESGQRSGTFRSGQPLGLALAYWGAVQGIGETLGWYPDAAIPEGQSLLGILLQ